MTSGQEGWSRTNYGLVVTGWRSCGRNLLKQSSIRTDADGFAWVAPKSLGCFRYRGDRGMDSEAQKILDENGWLWDPSRHGYRRDQDVISLEQLDVKGLTPEPQEVISERDRAEGLKWLRARVVRPPFQKKTVNRRTLK